MKDLADNSVDSIVTDPPYGLSFMGKEWDHGIPGQHFWEEALRVAKPGAHILAFGGTRTYHRLACALEDAGWEIRDCVMWVYGCLSEDTEILTNKGWARYSKDLMNQSVLCYDSKTDTFVFDKPKRDFFYANEHTAYRIESDFTDQIVSRNHRVLVERDGRKMFILAEALEQEENIPILESLSDLPEAIPNIYKRTSIKKQDLLKRVWKAESKKESTQTNREPNAVSNQSSAQIIRSTRAKITPTAYSGNVWCVEVSTGAFVARRNGKIFITGNSGFPKSLDISKAIDKQAGAERKVIGIKPGHEQFANRGNMSSVQGLKGTLGGEGGFARPWMDDPEKVEAYHALTAPATDAAKEWEGWGTALKPAYEPIILARKPIEESTVAGNVLKHGTGGINIDECRIVTDDALGRMDHRPSMFNAKNTTPWVDNSGGLGRFPSNFIHDGSEEVLGLFPNTVKQAKCKSDDKSGWQDSFVGGKISKPIKRKLYLDEQNGGSAARFFYCAKASKADRDEGLDGFEEKQSSGLPMRSKGGSKEGKGKDNTTTDRLTISKNTHPTVKPTSLMQYLCRLITPPKGTILDPFMGSGSTGKAAILEGFDFIGIEKEEEYLNIAKARIDAVGKSIEEKKPFWEKIPVDKKKDSE